MFLRRIFILMAYFFTFVAFTTPVRTQYSDKKGNIPFQTPMRYGRSGRNAINPEQRSGSKVIVSPRADTFYLGPRYGKRSSIQTHIGEVYAPSTRGCIANESMNCIYTGFSNMYRCVQRKYGTGQEFSSSQ